jgi:hypothetical protein
MSVSLTIHWPDGRTDDLPLMGQGTATGPWRDLGRAFGLRWLPEVGHYVPVLPETIDEVLAEAHALRAAAAAKGPNWSWAAETANRIIDALGRVRASDPGWSASFG